jgi:hypothetical protein
MDKSTNATATAKQETKKLCGHTLKGGCHLGPACPNYHPVHVALAQAENVAKKTYNLCGFHPNCTRPGCSYLHVEVLPKDPTAAPPAAHPALTGRTPMRPAPSSRAARPDKRAGPAGERKDRRPKTPGRKDGGRDGPEVFRTLKRLRGKANAIQKVEEANLMLSSALTGPAADEARERAKTANQMLQLLNAKFLEFGKSVDDWIVELGAKPDEDDLSEEDISGTATPPELPSSH